MIGSVLRDPGKQTWHYSRDGQKFGPTDLGGLRKMAASLHLCPDSLVWSEGLPAWVPATTIETLVFPPREELPPPLPAPKGTDPRYGWLYRSSDERMVLGVCAGLAHKWNVPVMAVRVAVVLLLPLLMGWAYFLGAFLPALPTKPSGPERPAPPGDSLYAMKMTSE
jgi:phage shock protein PspC (stress-responsive transcriptional regulator)